MFCNHCGAEIPQGSKFCNNCGRDVQTGTLPTAPPILPDTGTAPGMPGAVKPTDGKAIASLVCGVLSMLIFSIFTGIPAIILGHMSRSDIRRSMGRLQGEGMALAGLIMGYLSLAIIPFILIIAAIAIPNLLHARLAANESSAIASVRTLNTALVTYQATYPKAGYPERLQQLGPSNGAPNENAADLIDRILAGGDKSGYLFTYAAMSGAEGGTLRDKYFITATPIKAGNTGNRSFCTDESGVIRSSERNLPCTPQSPPLI